MQDHHCTDDLKISLVNEEKVATAPTNGRLESPDTGSKGVDFRTVESPEMADKLTHEDTIRAEIESALQEVNADSINFLKLTSAAVHTIELQPGTQDIKQKVRRKPYYMLDALKVMIFDMLTIGLLRYSHSDWNSPLNMLRKKDGNQRMTQDYRKLNTVTIKDAYPIPCIDAMLAHLAAAIAQ